MLNIYFSLLYTPQDTTRGGLPETSLQLLINNRTLLFFKKKKDPYFSCPVIPGCFNKKVNLRRVQSLFYIS